MVPYLSLIETLRTGARPPISLTEHPAVKVGSEYFYLGDQTLLIKEGLVPSSDYIPIHLKIPFYTSTCLRRGRVKVSLEIKVARGR